MSESGPLLTVCACVCVRACVRAAERSQREILQERVTKELKLVENGIGIEIGANRQLHREAEARLLKTMP